MSQMKHYLSILFILLLLVACDPAAELGTPFHKGQEVVLAAAIGEQRPQMMPQKYPHPQRVSGKDAPTTIDLLWDEGDEILVRVGEASSVFTLIDGAGTANASFMGTMPADGSNYTVSYPVDYSNKLLQQQTYVPDGIAKGLMKMSTASPGTIDDGFTLKAEHAVLGLQLTGNSEIGKLVLTRNAEKGATSVESYTLNCKLSNSESSGVTLTETATLFYIVLPAGIWEKGFTVDVYAADNTTIIDTFVTNKRFEFTAANATTMAEKEVTVLPEYVDLGLSVKWATFNVGASKPEDYGDYFAWGETEPKEVYDWSTYKWCDSTENNMTKYNATDGLKTLLPEDDAAHVNWGGEWRMPSEAELTELREYCTWQWTTQNGTAGYIVTGPNGNSIFLPAVGYFNNSSCILADERGYYLSNSLSRDNPRKANMLYFTLDNVSKRSIHYRYCGQSIRPVLPTNREVLPELEPAKRIGVFSVAKDKQVSFSQGNLQYIQSANLWRFAEKQYDYIGKGNIASGQLGKTIDMFAWSTDANPANKWGVTIAEEGFDGAFVDWGLNYIHGEVPGLWRTLSLDEWTYLFSGRQRATELWGVAQVEGVSGIIILPDRWNPTDELPFVVGLNKNGFAEQQSLSAEQWQRMEELGAVFLPAAGGRDGARIASSHIDSVGWYWSSTPTNPVKAGCVRFECNLMAQRDGWRQAGLSVRLVHDTVVPFTPEYVDLGLSVLWATTNVGARYPEGYGDYFAWGETEPKEAYDWSTYKWFDGTENNMTKYNATDGLKTLLPEDDAAHVNWGGEWRMPSDAELTELREYCTWQWTTQNGTAGYIVTGPNGNSIFLPDAGYRITTTHTIGTAYYWTRDLNTTAIQMANGIYFNQDRTGKDKYRRRCGFSVRPVIPTDHCLTIK